MIYTFACKNPNCEMFNEKSKKLFELEYKMSEIDKAKPFCPICGEPLKRVYSSIGMIKTNDGIK